MAGCRGVQMTVMPLCLVPEIERRLGLIPRLAEGHRLLSRTLLEEEHALTRRQKELMLLTLAGARESAYSLALHFRTLESLGMSREQLHRVLFDYREAGLTPADAALAGLALKLGEHPAWLTEDDIAVAHTAGLSDEQILEAVQVAAWSGYWAMVAAGLALEPDFEVPAIAPSSVRHTVLREPSPRPVGERQPLSMPAPRPGAERVLAKAAERYGFVPNVLRAQAARPGAIETEMAVYELWMTAPGALTTLQKECLFLVVSAVHRNLYCVAMHCEILRGMGLSHMEPEQLVIDYRHSGLPAADVVLMDTCLKLTRYPEAFSAAEHRVLMDAGYSVEAITEAVAIVGLAHFYNMLDAGLGVEPDFEPRIGFAEPEGGDAPKALLERARPKEAARSAEDPDAATVAKVRGGDTAAFEELVRKYGRRVERTVAGILGPTAEVEDAVQECFVKAFQSLAQFEHRSQFATWLMRIAVNAGLQRLRQKKPTVSLDDGGGEDDGFRPIQLRAWEDDPEQALAREERRALVHRALRKLPLKYRVVVILRDLEQLSTQETAAILGLEIAGVKTRLYRGRLMLREALSPHFTRKERSTLHA